MEKKRSKDHAHEHLHEEDIHLHEHEHDGVTHVHPHFHEETVHVHPHEHEAAPPVAHEHEHAHMETSGGHAHPHTYSFERYAHIISPVHLLDARVKLICLLGLVVAIVLTPPLYWERFLAYFVLLLILILFSRLPVSFILERSMAILPFVLLIALFLPFLGGKVGGSYNLGFVVVGRDALIVFGNVLVKAWLSILAMIILSASTRFVLLLKSLESLKVPVIFIALLSFIYRFATVLQDEITRIKRAHDSRSFGGYKAQLRVFGQMIGNFFIRSYERSERIYQAMVARGFDGTVRTLDRLQLKPYELVFGVVWLALVIYIQTWRF